MVGTLSCCRVSVSSASLLLAWQCKEASLFSFLFFFFVANFVRWNANNKWILIFIYYSLSFPFPFTFYSHADSHIFRPLLRILATLKPVRRNTFQSSPKHFSISFSIFQISSVPMIKGNLCTFSSYTSYLVSISVFVSARGLHLHLCLCSFCQL